jgi:hypothetical protein
VKNGFIHIEGKGPRQPENGQEKHYITFYPDNLKYEGQIVLETTTRDRKTLRYYKFKSNKNQTVHHEFRVFARQWFGYNILPDDDRQHDPVNEHHFYNALLNRVDLEWSAVLNIPQAGEADKVILSMTFEPGVPIEPFDEDAWAVVKTPVEGDEDF